MPRRFMMRWIVAASCAMSGGVLASGCGDGTGVCTGCCGPQGQTYCKDNWTKSECADWDRQGVNGVKWNFHEGQTCEERGTPAN